MPKHLTRIEVVTTLPVDLSPYTNGYPVLLTTDSRVYIARTDYATPSWDVVFGAEVNPTIRSVAAAYTVLATDEHPIVIADATTATFAVTLPAASAGSLVTVKKVDASANAVTVETPGAETIDGAANASLATQYEVVRLVSNGTNWFKI